MLKSNDRNQISTNIENRIFGIVNDPYGPIPFNLRPDMVRLFRALTEAILDEIYTEKELMEKAEHIILDKRTETDSI